MVTNEQPNNQWGDPRASLLLTSEKSFFCNNIIFSLGVDGVMWPAALALCGFKLFQAEVARSSKNLVMIPNWLLHLNIHSGAGSLFT